jgi:hypothetical protein
VNIARPTIRPVSLSEARAFCGSGYIAQEKMDGVFAIREWRGSTIAGEQMRDGLFYAFDVAIVQGDDCRRSPYYDRLDALRSLASGFDSSMRLVAQGNGGEFLEAVLERGGEGVVFKHREGYWGVGQYKAKRIETFDVRVTELRRNAVAVEYEGAAAGCVPMMKDCGVVVGDVVEISAYCRTAAGKFREPRFLRVRRDKA